MEMRIEKIDRIEQIPKEQALAIYGAGTTGRQVFDIITGAGYTIHYFIEDDENKIGGDHHGIPIVSLKQYMQLFVTRESAIILGSIYFTVILSRLNTYTGSDQDILVFDVRKIYEQEQKKENPFIRFRNKELYIRNIDKLRKICSDEESRKIIDRMDYVYQNQYIGNDIYDDICSEELQYFTEDVRRYLHEKKCGIIDGGAFHGEILTSLKHNKIDLEKLFMFEVDLQNLDILRKNVDKSVFKEKCEIIGKGLWDKEETLYIKGVGDQCRIVREKTNQRISVTTIDKSVSAKIHLIKMDIEGAELPALRGAERTMMRDRPALAISIYHSPEDFVQIPIYLHCQMQNYRWRIVHHTNEYCDTVLYGIPQN